MEKAQELFEKQLETYKINESAKILNRKAELIKEHKERLRQIEEDLRKIDEAVSIPDMKSNNSQYFTVDPAFFNNITYTTLGTGTNTYNT